MRNNYLKEILIKIFALILILIGIIGLILPGIQGILTILAGCYLLNNRWLNKKIKNIKSIFYKKRKK